MTLRRIDGTLHLDDVALTEVARFAGTPVYVYSWQTLKERFLELQRQFKNFRCQIHYAVKANSNLTILNRLAGLGASFDIVSGGELERVLAAKAEPESVVYSGVGKSVEELSFALKSGVGCINVESVSEFLRIRSLCSELHLTANIALRVNPEVDAKTHPYLATALSTSKFGLTTLEALELAKLSANEQRIELIGIGCHLGSQISDTSPYAESLDYLLELADSIRRAGIELRVINIGGGFGIRYNDEEQLPLDQLGAVIAERVAGLDFVIAVEPGRYLVGPAGVLISKIEYLKRRASNEQSDFAVVDAGMNDLIRPALYGAYHRIEEVQKRDEPTNEWNVVGPVCESGDFVGLERGLALQENDLIAIADAGAYGFSLSSNYNSRPRATEVLVDGNAMHMIRSRESMNDLLRLERIV